jgi:hypothetical protein
MIKVEKTPIARLRQGDILRDVEHIEHVLEESGIIEVSKIVFPLVIVLTQDCDLQYDEQSRLSVDENSGDQDKWLLSVLVAPLYNAEHVHRGEHLSELDMEMGRIPKKGTALNFLVSNRNPRYHYLEFSRDIQIVPSVIDFKHYFSANVEYLRGLKGTNFVCSVSDLFREHISQRFASFLARIGLPELTDG